MDKVAFAVCSGLFVLCLITSKKRPLSPTVFFYALWSFILLLSTMNLFQIYKPTDEAYFLIILMLIFFYMGSLTTFIPSLKLSRRRDYKGPDLLSEPNYRLLYFLTILFIAFTFIDCIIIVYGLLNGTPMWEMRGWRMGTFGVADNPMLARRTFIEEIIRSVVLMPFETVIPPVVAFNFFNPNSRNKHYPLLVLSLVSLLLSSFAGGGGRIGYMYYFGCFLLAFLSFSNRSLFKYFNIKKYRKYIYIVLFFGIVATFFFTNVRTGTGNFIKQTYTYFALPPTLLSLWLPEIKSQEPMFGMLTFFGLHSYFFRGFQALQLDFLVPQGYQNAFDQLLNAEIFRSTGYGVGNAFVTPIYYFFIDGGYPFVCFASMFFGGFTTRFFKKFVANINIRTFTYYSLVMYGVFLSMMRIQTSIPSYWISFVLAFVLLRSGKRYASVSTKTVEIDRNEEKHE